MTDRRRVPRASARIGTRGAVLLAVLLALVFAIAIVGSFVALHAVETASSEQVRLREARDALDGVVRLQLDQERELRGFLVTRDRSFLEPYLAGFDPFASELRGLEVRLNRSGLSDSRPHLRKMRELHDGWYRDVAGPLVRDPKTHVRAAETYGKIITDALRSESTAVETQLREREAEVSHELGTRINFTVQFSIAFVSLFAVAVLYFALAARTTAAALERSHAIAAGLQAALGVGWQPLESSTVGTAYVSATREAEVGGDLVDAWRISEHSGAILIADMSGKGIDAIVNTAFCKYSIRALANSSEDPAAVLTEFNRLFARTVADPAMFAVAFLGIFDSVSRTLSYVSAGHEPAFLRRDGRVARLEVGGPIIGMIADAQYVATTIDVRLGDTIVLTTDGLTEARDADGELLGEKAAAGVIAQGALDPQELCDEIIEFVRQRSGGTIKDDLAVLALRIEAGSS